jgi:regulator of replication initiation timing
LPSDLPSELIRWFQNVQRMLDRLAQAAERQNQLDAMVERLVRENGELREEMDNLRRGERRSDAAIKRGDRLVALRPRVVAQDALDRSERGE